MWIKRRINLEALAPPLTGAGEEESYPPVLSCVIHTSNEGKAIPFARNSYWRSRDDRCELRAVKACRGSKPRSSGGREEGGAVDCREIKRKKTRPTCLWIRFEFGERILAKSLETRQFILGDRFCFFKNNFFDNDLELKSNLEKDGKDGILRYFDINRREKVFAWIFSFCFFYVIATYRIAKYRE